MKSSELLAMVGGLSKEIEDISNLLELPLLKPDLFRQYGEWFSVYEVTLRSQTLGLKPPRGILLYGPPGTGKTHLARSLAQSTGSSLIVVSGPELSSAFHGETESKLRSIFDDARSKPSCIVVLDEIDADLPQKRGLRGPRRGRGW